MYRRHGLGEGDFDVLATLRRAGEPYERAPGELAAHTMVTTGAMTKRIDRLEHDGLVTRRPSAVDGRGRVVALTEAGRELIDQAFAEHMRNERRLVDLLTPERPPPGIAAHHLARPLRGPAPHRPPGSILKGRRRPSATGCPGTRGTSRGPDRCGESGIGVLR